MEPPSTSLAWLESLGKKGEQPKGKLLTIAASENAFKILIDSNTFKFFLVLLQWRPSRLFCPARNFFQFLAASFWPFLEPSLEGLTSQRILQYSICLCPHTREQDIGTKVQKCKKKIASHSSHLFLFFALVDRNYSFFFLSSYWTRKNTISTCLGSILFPIPEREIMPFE